MRLVPSLSCLLLALQLVSAIQTSHRHDARFIKIKRAVAGQGKGPGQDQHALNRRAAADFGEVGERVASGWRGKVKDLVKIFDRGGRGKAVQQEVPAAAAEASRDVSGPQPPESLTGHVEPERTIPVREHTPSPLKPEEIYSRYLEQMPPTEAMLFTHRDLLDNHEGRILGLSKDGLAQKGQAEDHTDAILNNRQALIELQKAQRVDRAKLRALYKMLAISGTAITGATVLNTIVMSSQLHKIHEQDSEIDRLRSAQKTPSYAPYSSNPILGQSGVPATNRGWTTATGGGLI